MIKELPQSQGSALGFEVTGKVSLAEEKEWISKIEKAIEIHGKINVLLILGEEAKWGIDAGLEDLKWLMTHMKQINKVAVVTDSKVWKWLVSLDSPFAKLVGVGEKYFPPSEIDEAWKWVRE